MTDFRQPITLNTGATMPRIGLGTWKSEPNRVAQAVEYALSECGYRHIDCAAIYGNEPEIGEALKKVFASGVVKREDIFITSKLWNNVHGPEQVMDACKATLRDLQLDYLDLYLMHWGIAVSADGPGTPTNMRGEPLDEHGVLRTMNVPIATTWNAMERLVHAGLVRAIGVANFTGAMLIDLLCTARIKPAVNQIELHPYNAQSRLVEYCHRQHIAVTAYSPLGTPGNIRARENGEPIILEDTTVLAIAESHTVSPAQVLLRWGIGRNTIVIPKSLNPINIKNNITLFDFELSNQEIETLNALDQCYRFVDPWEWWRIPYFD